MKKNTQKLQNLLLIGYSPRRVSLPYQLLTIGMNLVVLLLAIVLLWWVRSYYMELLWAMFPSMQESSMIPAYILGGVLFLAVSILNAIAIRRKVMTIWRG